LNASTLTITELNQRHRRMQVDGSDRDVIMSDFKNSLCPSILHPAGQHGYINVTAMRFFGEVVFALADDAGHGLTTRATHRRYEDAAGELKSCVFWFCVGKVNRRNEAIIVVACFRFFIQSKYSTVSLIQFQSICSMLKSECHFVHVQFLICSSFWFLSFQLIPLV
jgi:hypothetical protein